MPRQALSAACYFFFFFLNSSVAVEGAWLDCGVVGFHWLIGCWKMYALLGSRWCDAGKGSGLLTPAADAPAGLHSAALKKIERIAW